MDTPQNVMDRKKLAATIHQILDTGVALLNKETLKSQDFAKVKIIRTLASSVNAAVAMVQQETAQARLALVAERMKQLGFASGESGTERLT